ncbi:MAG: T9SS type A sorting domain-containing protein [Cyclobacteriaceae bacterium]
MKTLIKSHSLLLVIFCLFTQMAFSQAKVEMVYPNGSEELKFGNQFTIRWKNTEMGTSDRFYVYYSVNGGGFTAILNNFLPSQLSPSGDTLSYNWTVPDLGNNLDSEVRIRVLNNTQSVSDTSEAFRVYYEPAVDIQTPNGTEELKFGDTYKISWLNGDRTGSDRFYVYYSVNGGGFTAILNNFLPSQLSPSGDTLSYNWTVPDLGNNLDSEVRIRVLNNTRSVSDTSEVFRVYYEPAVDIQTPNGTEELKFGDTYKISWLNGDRTGSDRFYVYYSVNGGGFTAILNNFLPSQLSPSGDTLSYNWTVPDLGNNLDSEVRIRVLNNTRSVSDTSEVFRVYYEPSVDIQTPNGTEELKFGDTYKISWLNGDRTGSDRFYVYYSVNGGGFTAILNNFLPSQLSPSGDTLSYNWTVPDLGNNLDSEVRIRVLNNTRSVSDTSEVFRVYYEPSVDIQTPNGTEELKFGDTYKISWLNGDRTGSDRFYVYYSVNGGGFTAILNNFLPSQLSPSGDTLSYNWTVPDLGNNLDSEVRIRVLNNTRRVSDTSEVFRVYYEPKVEIISPEPGEFVLPSTTRTVSWLNGDRTGSDRYYLYYSVDGGGFTAIFNNFLPSQLNPRGDTLSYNWAVPAVESTNVRLRVLNNTRSISDTTFSFSICTTCPTVSLYTPNGGEVLAIGSEVEVGWNTGDPWAASDNVKVEYSTNGGATYEAAAIFDGVYSDITDDKLLWTVPNTETTQGIVRVTNVTQSLSDVSNAVFTITTPPAIPSAFSVTPVENSTSLTLTWEDNATNETKYFVQYSNDKVNWQNWINDLGTNVTTYTATGLSNIGYWWRVGVASSAFTVYSDEVFAGQFINAFRAITLDGSDDHIVIGDSTAFDFGTGDFTMEAWIRPSDLSEVYTIFSDFDNSASNSMGLATNAEGGLSAHIGNNQFDLSSEAGILQTDKWDHVALVRAADSAFLLLNGQRVAAVSGMAARSINSPVNLTIGKQHFGAGQHFLGRIDEVRIWNTAKTDSEILADYFTALDGSETGLLAYYQMNHTAGSAVADRSPNGRNATWKGSSSGFTSPRWETSGALVDNLPPGIPGDFTVTENETGGLDMTWTDNAVNETQYSIQYSTNKVNWFAWTNNLGVDANSYTVTGLNNIGYWWRVSVTTGVLTATSEEVFKGRFVNANRAISLNGSNQSIVVRDSTAFDFGTGDFTIEAWINTNDLSAIHTIISDFNNTANGSMRLLTTANGELAASIGSESFDVISEAEVLEINSWEHVSLVRAADSAFLYINGKRVASTAGMASRNLSSMANMTIGKQALGTEFYFNGQIDEVRIWNVARSESELQSDYFTSLKGDEQGLLAYYTMNHQAGTVVSDQSVNDYKADWSGTGNPSWVSSGALVDNEPPAVPTDFTIAKAENSNALVMNWTDNATNETSYIVQYSSDKNNWIAWTNNLGADVNTYTTGSLNNAGYWFRVQVSTAVKTAYSEEKFAGVFTGASRALSFDGTDDELVTNDSSAFDFGMGDFTIETWIKAVDTEGTYTIISDNNGAATGSMGMYLTQGGGLAAIIGSETFDVQAAANIIANKWYHTALVRKGDSARLYVNGRRVASALGMANRNLASEVNLTIGKQPTGTGLHFKGDIDEVRIWSVARSDNELLGNYLVQLAGNEENLEAYYQLNHQGGTVISDQSINDRAATWMGSGGSYTTSRWVASQALIDNTPFVSINAPAGGEFWEVGTSQFITWSMNNFLTTDNIEVRLSADGGTTSAIVSQGTSSQYDLSSVSSRFLWTVPDSITTEARIIVANTTQNISDTSAVFEIGTVNRSISILTPNGGEKVIQGENVNVKFEVEGILAGESVAFLLSLDSGASFPYTLRNTSLQNYPDSSFSWFVNQPVTEKALIRAIVSQHNIGDTTDAVFTIAEAPKAPVYSNLSASIVGDEYEMSYRMSEPGTGYMVILPNGSAVPSGVQIKSAALGESGLEGQVAIATFEYTDIEQTAIQSGSASFIRQSRYDIYLTAEDDEGELNNGQSIQNVFAEFTPYEKDSVNVNQVYLQSNGSSWLNTTEAWNELAISARPEITVEQERIVGLDLSDKGLEGGFPQVVTLLDSLKSLDLSGNMLDAIPNMTNMSALTSLNVSNNILVFSDLLPNEAIFTSSDQYSPQAELLPADSVTLHKGSSYLFGLSLFGQGNVYSWNVDYYNTYEKKFEELTSVQFSNLRLTNLNFDNMGTYYLEVTNPSLPDLTLSTGRIQVWATATLIINVTGENNTPLAQGAAYALRNRGPGLPFDSIPKINGIQNPEGLLFNNGRAVFNNLLLGEYLIAIRADPSKYLPTYYANTYLWEEADTLDFKDDLNQQMTMTIVPPPLTEDDGSGIIEGSIEADFGDETGAGGRVDARRKVKKAGCSMRRFVRSGRVDEDVYELVAYVESDDEGRFNFEFLPEGKYRFNIEYPGIPMDPDSFVEFVIGEGGADKFVLEATITEDGIAVERIETLGFSKLELDLFNVYPNPTTDRVFISTGGIQDGLYVTLVSLSGSELGMYEFSELGSPLEIELSHLQNGVYFLNVLDANDASKKISYKIVVRH